MNSIVMSASPSNKESKLEEEEIYETVLDQDYSVSRPQQHQIPSTNTFVSPQLSQKLAATKSFSGKGFNVVNEDGGKRSGQYGRAAKGTGGIEDSTSAKQYQSLLQVASSEDDYTSLNI